MSRGVENMAPLTLPDGTVLDLFGSGGGELVATALQTDAEPVPLLGSIPLSQGVRASGDAGDVHLVTDAGDPAAAAIEAVADAVLGSGRGLSGRSLPMRVR